MKNLVNKGFKYFVAIMMVFSLMSMNAWANGPESGTSSETGSTTTENKGTTKDTGDSQGDTADQLISNEEKKTTTSKESDDKEGQTDQTTDKKTDYTYEDKKISVKAVLANASAISDQAELRVKEIPESTTEYKKYQEALNKKSNLYSNVLLYDISFILDGKEVEPTDGNVKVSMSFKDQQLSDDLNVKDNNDLKVIHFKDNDVNKQESLKTTTSVKNETTSFETKSFSVVALSGSSTLTKVSDEDFRTKEDSNYGIIVQNYSQLADSESNFYIDNWDTMGAVDTGNSHNFINKGGPCYIGNVNYDNFFKWSDKKEIRFHSPPSKLYLGNSLYGDKSTISENQNKDGYILYMNNEKYSGKSIEFHNVGQTAIEKAENLETAQTKVSNMDKDYDAIVKLYKNSIYSINQLNTGDSFNIDLKELPEGTYVIEYKGNDLGDKNNHNFNISLNKNQHLIIYCSTNQSLTISGFTINGNWTRNNGGGILDKAYKGDEDAEMLSRSVSFYCPNTASVNLQDATGIFVAKNAIVSTSGTSGGIVAAKTLNLGSAEWHYRNTHLDSPDHIQFSVSKTFNSWPDGNFTFLLQDINGKPVKNAQGKDIQNLSLNKDCTTDKFGTITFNQEGTYYY